jgi:sortase A
MPTMSFSRRARWFLAAATASLALSGLMAAAALAPSAPAAPAASASSQAIFLPPAAESLGADRQIQAAGAGSGAKPAAPAAIVPAQATPDPAALPTIDATAIVAQYLAQHPVPQRLWIDKLKVNAAIQPVGPGNSLAAGVVEWSAPKNRNVGWHDYSGRIGEGRNIVLNGHNNIYGSVFRKLYTLQAGDLLRLGAGDAVVTYVVEEVHILKERGEPLEVRIQNASYIQPMDDDRLTLVSCWPENNNTHRVIVVARPQPTTSN